MNHIAVPCLMTSESIPILYDPIDNQGRASDLGIIAFARRFVLDGRRLAHTQRLKIGICKSDGLVGVRDGGEIEEQTKPCRSLGNPCRSFPVILANQTNGNTKLFSLVAGGGDDPERSRPWGMRHIGSPDKIRHDPSTFAVNQGIGAFLGGLGGDLRRFKCPYRDPYTYNSYSYQRPIRYDGRQELFAPVRLTRLAIGTVLFFWGAWPTGRGAIFGSSP